jgi:hypothetical protein
MCSKPNPETAEVCGFCGARLKPLLAGEPRPDPPREEPGGAEGELPGSDWLARIRAEADQEALEDEARADDGEPDQDAPDWLGRLRSAEMDTDLGPPEGEVPEWLSDFAGEDEAGPEDESTPEWLSRIRAREAAEGPTDEPADEEWLTRLRAGAPPEPEPSQEAVPDEAPRAAPEPPAEIEPEVPEPSAEFEREALEPPEFEEKPAMEGAPSEEPPEIPEHVPAPAEGLPEPILGDDFDWDDLLSEEEQAVISEAELPPLADALETLGPPELDDSLEAVIEAETPEPQDDAELPHVPALIFDESVPPSDPEAPDLDLDAIELPDWLSELKESPESEIAPEEEKPSGLAPATLPSWLEAMRPIETFRSVVEIESAEDQAVESAGPLAGLRGVLMAEPLVAMPRTAGIGVARLSVTERQYAQVELLHRIVEEEERERPSAIKTPARFPILRWVVSFLLVLAVAIPAFLPQSAGSRFALPGRFPPDTGPLFAMVEGLSTEQPVLVVFDYTPGYTGELEAVAGVFVQHLIGRGLRVATVSTWPTGPPLAESLLSRYGVNGSDYIHLGYLSGGPAAVQLFAAAPREAIPRGYNIPAELDSGSGWQSPILAGVSRISDFGMVAVITAGTENARTWTEQAQLWMEDTPLVMVLSAGAEPLVRPYYEALEPQVDGILTGMPAAIAYEQLTARPGYAQIRWDSFGAGLLVIEALLITGTIYGFGTWLVQFRRSRVKEDVGG